MSAAMSKRIRIVIWWLVIAESRTVTGELCPSSKSQSKFPKTYMQDLIPSKADFPDADWSRIRQFHEDYYNFYIYRPSDCQTEQGLCRNTTTFSSTKGTVVWQPTLIGYRRLNLCPFAYTEELYAFRDCLVPINETINETTNVTAYWTMENTSECPLPLFSRTIERFYNKTLPLTNYTESNCSSILTSFSCALEIRSEYPDEPVFMEDHRRTMKMCINWITNCSNYYNLSPDIIWNISDLLLDKAFIDFLDYDTGARFPSYLSWLFRTNENSGQEHDYNGTNIYTYERKRMNVGGNFSFQFPIDLRDQITATASVTATEGTFFSDIGSFLIKYSYILNKIYTFFYMNSNSCKMVGPLFYIQLQAQNLPSNETKDYQLFGTETTSKSISVEVTFRDPQLNTVDPMTMRCGRISSDQDMQSSSPYENPAPLQYWTSDCETKQINAIEVLCRCASPAFVAVFQLIGSSGATGATGYMPPPVSSTKSSIESDLGVFLGFPYVREIYITGEVFKAISLACLVITVLAYAICRKARKGTPTRILLNLCASLIVLIIVLYIAVYEAKSEIGCRVLNVLRYYLVLVSLLWNAVEAHNMYRMLVKVFYAETSHFVLKAGFFAWGLPMLAVGIGFAISIGTFDGSYVTFDGSYAACTFRCALRPETRIYGWIIPMLVIIVHNLIVFAMVLKVICRTNPLQESGQSQGRSAGQKLCGAVTMLVLLGIPWIMTAFAAIDAQANSAEDRLLKACSGIFVIFVGLQGLFIFLFHCVRNRTIRDLTQKRLNLQKRVSSLNRSNAISPSTQEVQNSTSSSSVEIPQFQTHKNLEKSFQEFDRLETLSST